MLWFEDGIYLGSANPESGGGTINNQDITVTTNGEYTAGSGYTGLGTVTVNVQPNIESLSITPTTSAQTITATGGVDGYSPISVSAVTASIDANIVAGNIKEGVEILGVTGTYAAGGGGDEISVLNLTGSTLATGDKVWLSPMYLGSTADVDTFSTTGIAARNDVVVSSDGTLVYDIYYGSIYNVLTETTTSVGANTNISNSIIKYGTNGLIFAYNKSATYSSSTPTFITAGGGSFNVATKYIALGGDYYYDAANSVFVKMVSGTMTVDKTYTHSFSVYDPRAVSMCYANGYIYYTNGTNYRRAAVDDVNQTVTYDKALSLAFSNNSLPYATKDGKYFFVYRSDYQTNFRIYRMVNNDLQLIEDIRELCSDMTPFYADSTNYSVEMTYDPENGILVLSNKIQIAVFEYIDDSFVKINSYTAPTVNPTYPLNATVSADGSVIGYRAGDNSLPAYVAQFQGSEAYKAVSYQNINISADSFTGFVSVGGNQGETVKVLTVMPEELNVSVTVNADNAIVLGGIE